MENNGQTSQGLIVTTADEAGIDANGADEVHITEHVDESAVKADADKKVDEKQEEKKEEKPEEKKESEEDKRFAAKFAALSRKEKQVKAREKELEQKNKDLEQRLKALEEQTASKAEKKEEKKADEPIEYLLKKDPFGTLQKYGITLDTLINTALNNGKLTPDMEMQLRLEELDRKYQAKIQEVEGKLSEKEKRELEAQEQRKKQEEEQAIEDFKQQLGQFISANKDAYELIEAEEAQDLVFDVIKEHYDATGEILDQKIAADEVEKHLLEEARKMMKLKKLSQSEKEDLKPLQKDEPKVEKKASVTLSNSQSQNQGVSAGKRQLSSEEALAEAAKLLRWKE